MPVISLPVRHERVKHVLAVIQVVTLKSIGTVLTEKKMKVQAFDEEML